ncbi:hypothetical protein XA3_18910 [Xylocopilactobacillus apicola]|uniref:Uncharacterized protein n=1 Tax=Xylocopilactobacillus apicola TaxID=2932184 RepID=A0AAU9DAM9_9LACO|nr:hypothetical protein XA3_18910 [Xylocopilactobacillus apicola]
MKKKYLGYLFLATVLLPGAFSLTLSSAAPASVQAATVTPRRAIIEYRYKIVRGYLYRRLYDASHDRWLGPWERA